MTLRLESCAPSDANPAAQAGRATQASFERELATLHRAKGTLEPVIAENQRLAMIPGHEESARQRIREARGEMRVLRRQTADLERLVRGARSGDGSAVVSPESAVEEPLATAPDDARPVASRPDDGAPA